MLKFHDFSTWDPKKVITSVVLTTFLRCLGFPLVGIPWGMLRNRFYFFVGGTARMFIISAASIFESRSWNFEKPAGQKRCSEFDSLHMLEFHDFPTWDPRETITPELRFRIKFI